MPRPTRWLATGCLALCAGALQAQVLNPSAALGKQRAAASRLEWEVKDAGHPVLGNIRFAYLRNPVETAVGDAKVYTRMYVSCQKGSRMLAIELTNGTRPDDEKGLKPNKDPRLFCSRPEPPGSDKLVSEELLSNWDVNELGDVMARKFRPFPLRECISIKVVQEVALPAGWAKKSAPVEFEISPYKRELDDVFTACGDVSAYDAPAAPTLAKAAPGKATTPPAAPPKPVAVAAAPTQPPKPAMVAPDGWLNARALSTGGKTNVRATPSTQGAVVTQLDPGTPVLVQKTANEWWRAKGAAGGTTFEGFIRQDRLAFR
jgi:hypothetical protein